MAVTSTAQDPRDKVCQVYHISCVKISTWPLPPCASYLTPVLSPAKTCDAQSCSEPSQTWWCCACSARAVHAGACWCSPTAASLLHGPVHAPSAVLHCQMPQTPPCILPGTQKRQYLGQGETINIAESDSGFAAKLTFPFTLSKELLILEVPKPFKSGKATPFL